MLRHFYNETDDPDRQDQLIDSLMMLYDQRIEMFGERGRVLGRKAADLYRLRPNDIPKLFALTEESIGLREMNSGAYVLLINFQSVIRLMEQIIEMLDNAGCRDDEFTETTAYWVAADKFERAATVAEDPSVQNHARELADTYKQYFPDRELIF